MKNILEVKVNGKGLINFQIIDKLPAVDGHYNSEYVTAIEPFKACCNYSISDGVWGYDLYTIQTEDEWSTREYYVAVETYIPMDKFIIDLFDNNPNPYDGKEIDLETAKADIRNFTRDGWMLPKDMTPEAYMEAWNKMVKRQLEA